MLSAVVYTRMNVARCNRKLYFERNKSYKKKMCHKNARRRRQEAKYTDLLHIYVRQQSYCYDFGGHDVITRVMVCGMKCLANCGVS